MSHTATHQRLAFEQEIADPFLVALLLAKSAIAAERESTFGSRRSPSLGRLIHGKELITAIVNLVHNPFDALVGLNNDGAPLDASPTPRATQTTRSVSRNLRPPTQTFRAICGSPWKPMFVAAHRWPAPWLGAKLGAIRGGPRRSCGHSWKWKPIAEPCWTDVDAHGHRLEIYGSEGWRFKSSRARCRLRSTLRPL